MRPILSTEHPTMPQVLMTGDAKRHIPRGLADDIKTSKKEGGGHCGKRRDF
jgi:hypothetical protein